MYFNSNPISAESNDKILKKSPKISFLGNFLPQLVIFLGTILGQFRRQYTDFGHMESGYPN